MSYVTYPVRVRVNSRFRTILLDYCSIVIHNSDPGNVLHIFRTHYKQCCGAETICLGSSSGSDFQKVSALEPALTSACGYLFAQLLN
jgi:hypothetical protein